MKNLQSISNPLYGLDEININEFQNINKANKLKDIKELD